MPVVHHAVHSADALLADLLSFVTRFLEKPLICSSTA